MREIRLYGSVRGVRRNPYPYRDTPPPDAVGSADLGTLILTRYSGMLDLISATIKVQLAKQSVTDRGHASLFSILRTVPRVPSTSIHSPLSNWLRIEGIFATAGSPYSRVTIAP
jgi:hypothetical protein